MDVEPLSDEFTQWVEQVSQKYVALTDEQRNATMDHLLTISSPGQLYFLWKKLELLLYRDFLKLLPLEISEHILSYLDAKSLLNCCQVSRHWNMVVGSSWKSWLQACHSAGLRVPSINSKLWHQPLPGGAHLVSTASYYKQLYLNMTHFLHDLKNDQGFRSATYDSHLRRVTATYYWNGKLATGGDDRVVCIWNCQTDECLATIHTECTITNIKFNHDILVISSYSGCLKSWNLTTLKPVTQYLRHITAVFSLDFSQELDLLVSGAADNCLKLWGLKSGKLLVTLRGHTHWIVKVILMQTGRSSASSSDSLDLSCNSYESAQSRRASSSREKVTVPELSFCDSGIFILSMDKDRILVWPMPTRGDYTNMTFTQEIAIVGNDLNFFTPGLHCDGSHVYFVKQDPRRVEQTRLCKWSLIQQKMVWEKELAVKVKAMVAVGKRYSCVLTPWVDNGRPNFIAFDLETLETVASWHLPPSRPSTPDCSQITFGERDWLDGFTGHNHHGMVLAAGLEDNTVYALTFKREVTKLGKPPR